MTPFLFHEVFATQGKLHAATRTIAGLGDILVIDDFYKDPDGICALLQNSALPPWKMTARSRNYRDYYDCRLTIPAHHDFYDPRDVLGQAALWQIIRAKLGVSIKPMRYDFSFNMFQWLNPPAQNYQLFPHIDGEDIIGVIIYLNREADPGGGTAFYRDDPSAGPDLIGYAEHDDAKVDIEAHCELLDVVPGKFNRCVVFPGRFPHGAYIGQHDFYTDGRWRINQVYFFKITR